MNKLKRMPSRVLLLGLGALLFRSGTAYSITRAEIMSASVKIADRLAAEKQVGRNWEDVVFLAGETMFTEKRFLERVRLSVGEGYPNISHGDYAGYAEGALDVYRLSDPGDVKSRETMLRTTDGPLAFVKSALRKTPENSLPNDSWWVEGGYGTRFWQDDLMSMPPWLAMLGSTKDGLPGNPEARDLAYEWIESYVYDHRPASTDPRELAVPCSPERHGTFLWDSKTGLFWHQADEIGSSRFWGRGNGWVAFGLARAADYLDSPYTGNYAVVLDQDGIRALLAKMAGTLRTLRTPDGGWPTNLLHPDCETAETSGTGLITFMLAKGVNEGWLDREVYAPIAIKALELLLTRVDSLGNVGGIQPPGTGPDCYTVFSDSQVNVNYGVGAVLLAAQEVAKFGDEELAPERCPEGARGPRCRPLGFPEMN